MVMGDTVQRPGGDAGVVRVHGTTKGLAISCDVTPRYCAADPREGGKQAVAECWRNLTAVGADPLAITDCMNFGNPERPEIMGEFVGAIEGMAEACTALDFPVVSGNVSLYNETNGVAIPPTPAIGGVGLIPDIAQAVTMALKSDGDILLVLGEEGGHLGQSLYMEIMADGANGAPPSVDLDAERRTGDLRPFPDPGGARLSSARRFRRRPPRCGSGDGARGEPGRGARGDARAYARSRALVRGRSGPLYRGRRAGAGGCDPQGGCRRPGAGAARGNGRRRCLDTCR